MDRSAALKKAAQIIDSSHDSRITNDTLAYWRDPKTSNNQLVIGFSEVDGIPVSVCATAIRDSKTERFVIATLKTFRKQGHAKRALQAVLPQLIQAGIAISAIVAEDNLASIAALESAGLREIKRKDATRSSGTFQQIVYSYISQNEHIEKINSI